MKINKFFNEYLEKLKQEKIESPEIKLIMLMAYVLNTSSGYIKVHREDEFPENKRNFLESCFNRLIKDEPVQYITNSTEFFGLDFYVDRNVLIPQPDTEILVETAIGIVNNEYENKCDVLDLCTGSGAIAISIKKNTNKNCNVFASDISKQALEVAKRNSFNNEAKIDLIESNLFEKIDKKFNVIVSNPPYIRRNEIQLLPEEVKFEPVLALDGGENGLDFYENIASESKKYLEEDGYLLLEIGFDQKDDVTNILKKNNFKKIICKKDYGNNDRVIIARI